MSWFSWELYASLGMATSILFLVKYYFPSLKKVKSILIEQDINPKDISIFHPARIVIMSFLYGITYTILFPFILLGIIFSGDILRESTENMLLKGACENA